MQSTHLTRCARQAAVAGILGAVALGGAACSSTPTAAPQITANQVAAQAATTLQKTEPSLVLKEIHCPKNLAFKVGASENCVITVKGGKTAHLNARISVITGSNANLHFKLTE